MSANVETPQQVLNKRMEELVTVTANLILNMEKISLHPAPRWEHVTHISYVTENMQNLLTYTDDAVKYMNTDLLLPSSL